MPLVSTYKKREVVAPEPLPPDWSEHTAPTGQTYYFNATTQQSTYTRPTAANTFALANPTSNYPYTQQPSTGAGPAQPQSGNYISLSDFAGPPQDDTVEDVNPRNGHQISRQQFQSRRRNEAFDRPKHKSRIPNCEPWLLVRTKLGRRFAHNPETNESFWRMPKDVWVAVKALDLKERQRKERRERGEASESESEVEAQQDEAGAGNIVPVAAEEDQQNATDSDEYTEVTDSEGEEGAEDGDDTATTSKRQRTSESEARDDDGPVEFDEDDMAYQLQMMSEMQNEAGVDDGQHDDDEMADADDHGEEDDLSPEDAAQLFKDLLDDHNINPYSPFEKLIEEGSTVIQDDRWIALPTMKSRREVWDSWTRESIAALQERKKLVPTVDPKVGYLEFLSQYATPKLYWPEFKRKYRKETAMKDLRGVSEKDKEKLFRDHIKRLALSTATQKSDLTSLLKATPLSQLNNSSSCRNLPASILTDLRYITLPPKLRDPLIETFISTLPGPPSDASQAIAGEVEAIAAKAKDRKRREDALKERSRRVEEEKRRNERDLRDGRRTLQEEEMEIERAMKVGKSGLKGQLRE